MARLPRQPVRHRPPVLVSAHRFGAGSDTSAENSRAALAAALDLGVDYVEFDVQRCYDGTFVVSHSDRVAVGDDRVRIAALTLPQLHFLSSTVLTYDEVLDAIAGRAKAHIDFKFTSPRERYDDPAGSYEADAARRAVDRLGTSELLFTTLHDRSARALADWADRQGLDVLVGLSLGRSVRGMTKLAQLRVRWTELRPKRRFRDSRANLVVAKHTLARWGVAQFARRRGLPLLVWTVDTEPSLRYWMRPGRAFLVTSNHPEVAMRVRDGRRRSRRTS